MTQAVSVFIQKTIKKIEIKIQFTRHGRVSDALQNKYVSSLFCEIYEIKKMLCN